MLPVSTIIQSHCGLPSGLGHFTPIFFKLLISSSAVESACLVDLHVAIMKLSAIEDLLVKSIIFKFSALASSNIEIILFDRDELLIFTSEFYSLLSNFCRRNFYFFILNE